jgi:hypothetical protein
VPDLGLHVNVLGRRTGFGPHAPNFRGLLEGRVRFGASPSISRVEFHVANFPFVIGDVVKRGAGEVRGRIRLEASPWLVILDPVRDDHPPGELALPERAREVRGYAITHVGELSRLDGSPFGEGDADEILDDVTRTLSFARGAFSSPMLRTGFNEAGRETWTCWTGFRTDAAQAHETWFSKFEPGILSSVFSGWRAQAATANSEVLRAALHLFVNSHAPGLASESRLILAQAALEGLADGWPFPPLPGAPIVPRATDGRVTAAERIGKIAVSLGVPLSVPASLPHLASLAEPTPTATGPERMTWIRNKIAHLGNIPRLAEHPSRIRYEARQLATQYLELALLRLLEAEGKYLDRLSARMHSDVIKLPWKS